MFFHCAFIFEFIVFPIPVREYRLVEGVSSRGICIPKECILQQYTVANLRLANGRIVLISTRRSIPDGMQNCAILGMINRDYIN
jgi:hypothetical protein